MRRRWIGLGIAALGIGVLVLVYRGPGRAIVRGHVGDVAATMLVYAVLGVCWRARPAVRAVATFAIASALEAGQTLWHTRTLAGELLVGSTFDGVDFVAYALGVAIAVAVELAPRRGASSATRTSRSTAADDETPRRA